MQYHVFHSCILYFFCCIKQVREVWLTAARSPLNPGKVTTQINDFPATALFSNSVIHRTCVNLMCFSQQWRFSVRHIHADSTAFFFFCPLSLQNRGANMSKLTGWRAELGRKIKIPRLSLQQAMSQNRTTAHSNVPETK